MPQPRSDYRQILNVGSASAISGWMDLSLFGTLTMGVRLTVSAATLQGSLRFRGTNNFVEDANEPILQNGTALTGTLPSGITMTGGIITFNNPAITTGSGNSFIIFFPQFPEKIQADYTFTSGGGTVSLIVTAAGWTV